MTSRRAIVAALCLAASPALAPRADAAPPRISNLADSSRLTDQDRNDIRRYSQHWSDDLGSNQPDEVDEATAKLIEPLRAVRINKVFRLEYAKALLPHLERVVKAGRPHPSVNAMKVVALLGTPDALDFITENADQQDYSIRLWAAKAFPVAVDKGVLDENDINRALRQFGQAASREEDWRVLTRQFEAIASVESRVARDVQVNVLKTTAKRMEVQEGPSDLMLATYPALVLIRNGYIELNPSDQEAVGKSLAPVLASVCDVANKHWEGAQDDARASNSYRGAIRVSESLLKLIDAHVRPRQARPRTELLPAWEQRDRPRFEADQDKWRQVISGPPYSRR